jgi:HSP20 family protein
MGAKKQKKVAGEFGVGGLLGGLGSFLENLGELAEKGKELRESGEINGPGGKMKGVYGFHIKFGLGDDDVAVEPFGNVQKDERTGVAVVSEVREPMVDVFDEKDRVVVIAEMPGVGESDVKLDLKDDVLVITAEAGDKKYRKEVLLPASFTADRMTHACNHGMLEVKLSKSA